jgi:modulator of FtsH protease
MSYQISNPTHLTLSSDRSRSLFAQTMGYVASAAALFALGAYAGRDLDGIVGIVAFIGGFGALIGMQFASRRSQTATVGLLAALGLLLGLALAPVLADYASADPQAVWRAGAATALFIGAFGTIGYSTRRDLSGLARVSSWALLALLAFGVVLFFVSVPGGALIYSIIGLAIFAGYTLVDFQRLRRSTDITAAPLIAASIFLDILNVFLLLLQIVPQED